MKPSDEFPEVGKKLPYREPNDFFEGLSEKTLQLAKNREQNRRKTLILWKTLTVAASVSALALIGYYLTGPEKPVNSPIVQEKQPAEQHIITEPKIEKQTVVATETKNKESVKTPEKNIEKIEYENVDTILTDLSDEDLQQLAAMYEADPFINETEQ